MKYLLLLAVFLISDNLSSQQNVFFIDSKEYDENRYSDIKGKCYLFDKNVSATLYDKKGSDYKNVLINYNGKEGEIEAYNEKGKFIVLNPVDIKKIVVTDGDHKDFDYLDELVIVSRPDKKLEFDYYIQLVSTESKSLFVEFDAPVSIVTERPPGEIIEKKKIQTQI